MMKLNLPFFIIFLLLVVAGCIKPGTGSSTVVLPNGKFTGTFTRYHLTVSTKKVDTATANIILTLSTTSGFTVTGDTTKIHAGSYGSYNANGTYIEFSDLTLPTSATTNTAPPTKYHLNGVYQYNYSGSTFQISLSTDTLAYFYNLTATP